MKFIAGLWVVLISPFLLAQSKNSSQTPKVSTPSPTYKVRQNIANHKILFLEEIGVSKSYKRNQAFTAHFADGRSCEIFIVGRKERLLKFNTDGCELSDDLVHAVSFEESLPQGEESSGQPLVKNIQPASNLSFSRGIEHLSYVPEAGKFLLTGGLTGTYSKSELKSLGIKTSDAEVSTGEVKVGILAGLLDSLAVGVSLSDASKTTDFKPVTGSTQTSKEIGLESPTVDFKLTFLEQSESHPVDMVLGLEYKPKIGTSKFGTTTDDGNQISYNDEYSLSLDVTHKRSSVELDASVYYNLGGKGRTESATTEFKVI